MQKWRYNSTWVNYKILTGKKSKLTYSISWIAIFQSIFKCCMVYPDFPLGLKLERIHLLTNFNVASYQPFYLHKKNMQISIINAEIITAFQNFTQFEGQQKKVLLFPYLSCLCFSLYKVYSSNTCVTIVSHIFNLTFIWYAREMCITSLFPLTNSES